MALNEQNAQPEQMGEATLVDLTADIVSAYVSHNNVAPSQLPELIGSVNSALRGQLPQPEPEPQEPAVSIRRSVKPDEITCLECGKRFKSIKRHLQNAHGLSPNEYRAKWNLARDYPMVAPNYAEARSALAKSIGLGRKKGEPVPSKGRRRGSAKAKAEAPAA
jgi:predicted transcriptional regulator